MCALAGAARALAAALEQAGAYVGENTLLLLVVVALALVAALPLVGGRFLYVYAYEQGRAAGSRIPLADSMRGAASGTGAAHSAVGGTAASPVDAVESGATLLVVRDLERSHRAHGRLARGVRSLFATFDAVLDAELPRGTAARKRADVAVARSSGAFVRLYQRSAALLDTLNTGK